MGNLGFDISLDKSTERPLYDQLRERLAHAIVSGAIEDGQRLPSTREVAERLEVNRATATEAYRRLELDGLVERRQGSGTYARRPRGSETKGAPPDGAPRPGPRASRALLDLERRTTRQDPPDAPEGSLDLAALAPHEDDFRSDELRASLDRVLSARRGAALSYGPPAGDARLREILAERLRARGLAVDAGGILIVGGAQQGLDLVFRAFLDPGDAALTESPSYHLALDLLRFHRAEIASIPLLPSDEPGMASLDFDRLDDALRRRRPVLAYAMPNFQNPTGLTLDLPTRQRLARACSAGGVLLVEDDYEADLRHSGRPLPSIAALPEAGSVVYVGTLSKALFPGLRIGWVAGSPDVLARLAQVKRLSDLSGAVLLQAVAADLLETGAYDRHLEATVARAGRRLRALREALVDGLPSGCRVTAPQGGHVLWVEAPVASGHVLAQRAAAAGVLVTAGEGFMAEPGGPAGVRCSIARVDEAEAARAGTLLAGVVRELVASAAGREAGRPAAMERPVTT